MSQRLETKHLTLGFITEFPNTANCLKIIAYKYIRKINIQQIFIESLILPAVLLKPTLLFPFIEHLLCAKLMLNPRNTRLNRAGKILALMVVIVQQGNSNQHCSKTFHILVHLILITTLKVPMSTSLILQMQNRGFTGRKMFNIPRLIKQKFCYRIIFVAQETLLTMSLMTKGESHFY